MMTRDEVLKELEYLADCDDLSMDARRAIGKLSANDQAQRAVIESLKDVCANAYVVVGQLSYDAGLFEHPINTQVLDNLSAGSCGKPIPHQNIPAYPASQQIEQQAKEIEELKSQCEQWKHKWEVVNDCYAENIVIAGKENKTLREALQALLDAWKINNDTIEGKNAWVAVMQSAFKQAQQAIKEKS